MKIELTNQQIESIVKSELESRLAIADDARQKMALEIAENIENKNKTWFQNSYPYTSAFTKPGKARAVILANLHHDLGHLLGRTGNIEQNVIQYNKVRKIAEEIGDTVQLGFLYMNFD